MKFVHLIDKRFGLFLPLGNLESSGARHHILETSGEIKVCYTIRLLLLAISGHFFFVG